MWTSASVSRCSTSGSSRSCCPTSSAALQPFVHSTPPSTLCKLHGCQRPLMHASAAPSSQPANNANVDLSKFADKAYLDQAAKRFALGVSKGFKEDELVAYELGASALEELTDAQKAYSSKIKQKLVNRSAEMQREEAASLAVKARAFEAGKRMYEKGEYPKAVTYFEMGTKDAGPDTQLGGECQLWLGLSYQAVGNEAAALELYQQLEDSHPVRKIQKQAADLKYILEAPKLELSEEERVKIPLLKSETWRKPERKMTYNPRANANAKPKVVKEPSYWDKATWDTPGLSFVPDQWYLRAAWAALLIGLTVYVNATFAR